MYAEISALTQSAQALFGLLKSVGQFNEESKINIAINDLMSKLTIANMTALETQEKLVNYITKNSELEQRVEQLENWNKEKESFKLKEIATGNFAFVDTKTIIANESSPKLCATCFEKKIKSYLQQTNEPERKKGLTCNTCRSKLVFSHYLDNQTK